MLTARVINSAVVTLPLVYQYVQALQTHMMAEIDYCKVVSLSCFNLFFSRDLVIFGWK
jgi:hypothetical protein